MGRRCDQTSTGRPTAVEMVITDLAAKLVPPSTRTLGVLESTSSFLQQSITSLGPLQGEDPSIAPESQPGGRLLALLHLDGSGTIGPSVDLPLGPDMES